MISLSKLESETSWYLEISLDEFGDKLYLGDNFLSINYNLIFEVKSINDFTLIIATCNSTIQATDLSIKIFGITSDEIYTFVENLLYTNFRGKIGITNLNLL